MLDAFDSEFKICMR